MLAAAPPTAPGNGSNASMAPEVTAAEAKVTAAEAKVVTAKQEVVIAEAKVETAKKEVVTARLEVVTVAKQEVTAANLEVTAAKEEVVTAKQDGDKLMIAAAYQSLKCASEGQASAQAALATAEVVVATAQAGVVTAQAGVVTAQAGVASAHTVLDACCIALAAVLTRRTPDASATPGAASTSGAVAEMVATDSSQGPASSFTSSHDRPIDGVGMCFSSEWLRVDVADGAAAFRREFGVVDAPPDVDEVARVADVLRTCVMDTHSLSIVHETKTTATTRAVQNHHLDTLCVALGADVCKTTTGESRQSLQDLGCGKGVATAKSSPDAYLVGRVVCHRDDCSVFDADAAAATTAASPADTDAACNCSLSLDALVVGIGEAKHTTDSAVEALRQAFVESTNVALEWRRRGVPCARVTVPVWATTGQLVKFAVTRMLEPAFPYLVILSKTLDLADARDRTEAATLFASMMAWCRTPVHAWDREANAQLSLELSTRAYHLKPLTTVFLVADDFDVSLAHMLHVLQRLQPPSPASAFVEAPITVRTEAKHPALVFRNLVLDGYQIGVPAEHMQRKRYLAAIRVAMEAIHKAGVVHLDFYPSNFMWKETSEAADGSEGGPSDKRVFIKIIDWDAAHVLDAPLTKVTHSRMASHAHRTALVPNGRDELRAVAAWDTSLFDVLCAAAEDAEFHTPNKATLDDAFWRACRKAAKGSDAVLSHAAGIDGDNENGEDVCHKLAALGVGQ
jgi:hypothetical protein